MTDRTLRVFAFSACLLLVFLWGGPASAQNPSESTATPDTSAKGAPYVPSSKRVSRRLLQLADVSPGDVVYDLGSGDGRIVIMAAKEFGARGVGVEIDSQLVQKARLNAQRAGVSHRVEFRQGDLFNTDLSEATVVTLYLWPDMNNRLRPKLQRELDPGDRIVSHSFDIDGWPADTTVSVEVHTIGVNEKPLFQWTVRDTIVGPDTSATTDTASAK